MTFLEIMGWGASHNYPALYCGHYYVGQGQHKWQQLDGERLRVVGERIAAHEQLVARYESVENSSTCGKAEVIG